MTDDDIRQVFAELQRIGVDLGKPPGLAIGTGFADGALLPWLQALPDTLGHDEFAARLTAYVTAAQPNAELPTRADGKPHRGWPSVEQLHAAADVLAREWDPLGARLGDLTREDVLDFAYQALQGAFFEGWSETLEQQIARFLRQIEQTEFGLKPSPIEQRRYLARRIRQVIIDHPGETHEKNLFDDVVPKATHRTRPSGERTVSRATGKPRSQVVGLGPRADDPAPLDANAACSECGSIGTLAVVARDSEPQITRYCAACWPKVRPKYWHDWSNRPAPPADQHTPDGQIAAFEWMQKFMREPPAHDARYVASASWDDRSPFIEAALKSNERESPADKERHLRMLAADLVKQAPNMYGPMPPAVASFVAQYAER